MKVPVDTLRKRFGLPDDADIAAITRALAASAPPQPESHGAFMARAFPDVAAGCTGFGPDSGAERRAAELVHRRAPELATEAMFGAVHAMTDQELAAASARSLPDAARRAVLEEADHRAWMSERLPQAARAAGYTPRRMDLSVRRPVEGRDFSY